MNLPLQLTLFFLVGLVATGCVSESVDDRYAMSDTTIIPYSAGDGVHKFRLMISLPRGYSSGSERFPVIYLLDADYSFALARNELRHFTDRNQLQRAIIVGVGYPGAEDDLNIYHRTRVRDYTPTRATGSGYGADIDALSGHAKEFQDSLANEIIPMIDRRFRTVPGARMIVGHSYGGLFATYTMLSRPGLFSDYVIVSPSYWYDNRLIFRLANNFIADHHALSAHVFYAVGSFEGGGQMAQDLKAFDGVLRAANLSGYESTLEVFDGETHNSVVPGALSRGLRVLYRFSGEAAAAAVDAATPSRHNQDGR